MNTRDVMTNDEQGEEAASLYAALVEYVRASSEEPPELLVAIEFFERRYPNLRLTPEPSDQHQVASTSETVESAEARRMAAEEIHAVFVRHFAYYGAVPLELVRAAEFLKGEKVRE